MKFNFKKITAVFAGALMTFGMAGFAMGASYPEPFDGSSNAAVVYGSDALSEDEVTASNFQDSLGEYLESSGSSSGSSGTGVTDDNLHIGDMFGDVELGSAYSGGVLYDSDLDLLASDDLDGEEYDQTLEVLEGNKIMFDSLSYEEDYTVHTDFAEDQRPVLYLEQGEPLWNYTLEFDNPIDVTEDEDGSGEEITLAGKTWTVAADLSAGDDLTLWASSVTANVGYKESETVTVGDEDYELEVTSASEEGEDITLAIDDEKESGLKENDQMSVGDLDFYIKSIDADTFGDENDLDVEIFVGADELVIGDSFDNVELNEEVVESVKGSYEGNNLTELDSINLEFTPEGLEYDSREFDTHSEAEYYEYSQLEITDSIIDPVLGTIGFEFTSGSLEYDDEDEEFTSPEDIKEYAEPVKFEVSGDEEVRMAFTNEKEDEFSTSILEKGETDLRTDFKNLTRDDRKDTKIVFNTEGADANNTHIAEIEDVEVDEDVVESVTFSHDDREVDIGENLRRSVFDDSDEDLYVCHGGVDNNGTWAEDNTTFSIQKAGCASDEGAVSEDDFYDGGLDSIYTKDDVKVDISAMIADLTGDSAAEDATGEIVVTEPNGDEMTFDVTQTDEDDYDYEVALTSTHEGETDDEGDYGYYMTKWGSYMETEEDDNSMVEAWIPEEEQVTYDLLIGEAGEVDDEDSDDETGAILVTDSEVSDVDDMNLIVVGGSCINTVAADLLGVDPETCGEDFTDATGVGSGEAYVKGYSDSDVTSEHAVLVAGYSWSDTRNAQKYMVDEKLDTTEETVLGSEQIASYGEE